MTAYRYDALIGTGGIGSGSFFALRGNDTLGREESRGGRFLDQRDHCKLHIIAHYVRKLLGPKFVTLPVGMVGDDEVGRRMAAEMADAGMDTRYVAQLPGGQTLYSICFLYPDGAGGNLTTDDSASSHVTAEFVRRVEPEFAKYRERGVALAAPEVPLEARWELLRLGTAYGFLRAASFTAQEMPEVIERGMLRDVDVLGVNSAEAAAGLGMEASAPVGEIVAAAERFREQNRALRVCVTAGARGSWMIGGDGVRHQPAFAARARTTAGAGDAHLAALIVGAVLGIDDPLGLAAVVAGLSVESQHTINPDLGAATLAEFAERHGYPRAIFDMLLGEET